jgi:uncharacterized protein
MLLSALLTAVALQATPAQIQRIRWVPNPRSSGGTWVADPSHHLRDSTVRSLNQEIAALEQATGAEIAVVVVDSTSGLTPFDFALTLHRGWGVGKSGKDNGIVFLWVPTQRAVQISVGYGLEGVLPDRRAGRIRDTDIFPAFRRQAFDEGVLAGVRALAAAAREETSARQGITPRMQTGEGVAARPGADRVAASQPRGGPGFLGWLLGVLAVAAGGGLSALGALRYRRSRPRLCPKCRTKMTRLDEQADDEFLDKGQRDEEKVRSVDYDVWRCPQCNETLKLPHRRWITLYSDCPKCRRRTLRVKSKTIRSPTTHSEGIRRVSQSCESCGFLAQNEVTIPRVTPSSSSGGSSSSSGGGGGSSFGGGSAGGGGAGGTY